MQRTSSRQRLTRLAFGLAVTAATAGAMVSMTAQAGEKTAAQAQPQSPEITSRQEKDQTIEEYRIHGKLYAIKITPRRGAPYMLVDHSGDGNFQMESNVRVAIPEWTLMRW